MIEMFDPGKDPRGNQTPHLDTGTYFRTHIRFAQNYFQSKPLADESQLSWEGLLFTVCVCGGGGGEGRD